MSDEAVITVARFASAEEAYIARGALEADGIAAEVADEATAGWLWHLGTALGGVKLLVAGRDAARARQILNEAHADVESPEGDYEKIADELPAEADARRAWWSAVYGIVFPPLLLYAIYLVIKLLPQQLSPRATRQFYLALTMILIAFAFWWMLLAWVERM